VNEHSVIFRSIVVYEMPRSQEESKDEDIQVITKRPKKRTTTKLVTAISSKKAKPKRKKESAVRQMRLL
jgi:hypothetical protein